MIQIKQKKAKKVVAAVTQSQKLEALTEALKGLKAELDAKIEEAGLKSLQTEIADLEKELLAEADILLEPEEKRVINGVEIGAKGNQTTISDIIKVAEILTKQSPTLFFEVANPSITELRRYMTPQELEQCTETKATRKRTLRIK